MARSGGRSKGASIKCQWRLPNNVIQMVRHESARLDVTEGKLVAAILHERLAQSKALELFARTPRE